MKNYFSIIALLFILTLVLFFPSCKKSEPGSIPNIELFSPAENSGYKLPDSIYVDYRITDSREIKTVMIQLVDEGFIPVLPAIVRHPNAKESSYNFYYSLDELVISTGNYFLQVRAENDNEGRNKYQPIVITSTGATLNQLLVITSPSDTLQKVSGLTTDGVQYPLFTIAGDYSDSEINNQQQLLFVSGKMNLNIAAYAIDSGEELWRIPDIAYKPMHNNNCLYVYENTLYASLNYQHIYGYDHTGKITYDAPINETEAPGTVFRHQDYVLADIQKKNASQPFIRTYYAITGNEKQTYLNWMQVVDFFHWANDSVIICANTNDVGKIAFYDVQGNSNSDLYYFESPIICVTAIQTHLLLIGLENSLFEFNLQSGTAVQLQQDVSYSVIGYEKFSELVFLATGNQILIYSYPEMEYQKTVTFSDTILDVLFNYST